MESKINTVTIVGLGLIGGSFALALKKTELVDHIIGVDASAENAQKALELGIADEILELNEAILKANLIVLAIPISNIEQMLPKILDQINTDTIVLDLGSTKYDICKKVANHPNRKNFIATHPIAGTENSGPEAAFPELYLNKIAILCEVEKSDKKAVDLAKRIYQTFWMKVIELDAKAHDTHIAYVSHLSHFISFALSKTVLEEEKNEKTIFDMAGSGFASTVRLAKSSPDMWIPIFQHNKNNLLKAINLYQKKIEELKILIENDQTDDLEIYLKDANQIRRVLELK